MSLKLCLLSVIFCITLCVQDGNGAQWGYLPPEEVDLKAFTGGSDSKDGPAYVIKGYFQGFTLPGKYTLFNKRASVSWEGKEHTVDKYEFLFKNDYQFEPIPKYGVPSSGVVGGHIGPGEAMYICRTFKGENKDACFGRLYPNNQKCYVGYNGVEYEAEEFDVMVYGINYISENTTPHSQRK